MSKTVRYKLNKGGGKRNKRRKFDGGSKKKSVAFLPKLCKICISFLFVCLIGYWFFVAYTTVRDIKIIDVVGQESDVVEFADMGKVRRTLIVYENPNSSDRQNLFILAVFHNEDLSETLFYYFPKNLYLEDFLTGKHISIENLTDAGDSYMYEEKYAYVINQIEEQMAVNFDSYVWFGSEISKNFVSDSDRWGYNEDEVLQIFSKLSFFNLIPKYYKVHVFEDYFHSNMSFLEMYSYFQNIRGTISAKSYKYIDIREESLFENITLSSGKNARSLNVREMDISLRENIDILRTRDLTKEHVKVEIYNGTEIPGYARVMARKVYNAGCRVIRHENSGRIYENTTIYVSDSQRFENGLSVVGNILPNANIVEGRPDFLTTGDIVIVLGIE